MCRYSPFDAQGVNECRAAKRALVVSEGEYPGEPFCRLYEKGAPFGEPLIQAKSKMVPPQNKLRSRAMRAIIGSATKRVVKKYGAIK